ncbi:MAG TPA: hypothetical protein DCO77_12825 [Nitrospiraceae bacterium]|nr:hypothetical protein [Nitrospiraceae bacterium]
MEFQKNIIKSAFILGIGALLVLGTASPAISAMDDYCSVPPFLSNTVPPNVLFVLDNSGSMNCMAYPGTYDPTQFDGGEYFGYYDSDKMYSYTGNDWVVTTADPSSATLAEPIASGNLLNWATMRRMDAAKKLLNGGKANPRSPAPSFTVKLVGEVPNNGAYCSSEQTVGAFDNSGAIPESHLPAPYTNVLYPYSGDYSYSVSRSGLNLTSSALPAQSNVRPNADLAVAGWTVIGAPSAWEAVDETSSDGNTTRIEINDEDTPALFDYDFTGDKSGTIERVSVVVRARKTIRRRTQRIQGIVRVNGTDYPDSWQSVSYWSYNTHTFTWSLNPETGLAWTWPNIKSSGVGSLESFGVQMSYNARNSNVLRVTQVYLVIVVSTPDGGPFRVIIDTGKTAADEGIIGALTDEARFGLGIYNSDGDGGNITDPVHFEVKTSMLVSIDNMKATTSTPLAETLFTMVRSFRQDPPWYNAPNGDFKTGEATVDDPYYYKYTDWSQSNLPDQYVPCAKSFILLLTDGEPTNDTNLPANPTGVDAPKTLRDYDGDGHDPGSPTDYLDDVALWARTADARPDDYSGADAWKGLAGMQNIYVYSVFMFGRGSELLKDAAINGGFEDLIKDNQPACEHPAIPGSPSQGELKECYRDSDENGTLDPAEDLPLTYYEGDDGYELQESITEAIASILRRAASGTAVSVLTTSSRGVGSMVQAYFLPVRQDGIREVTWTGYTQNLWLDTSDNLREDGGGGSPPDYNLILDEDRVIKLYFDSDDNETMAATFSTEADGTSDGSVDGTLNSCKPESTKSFMDTTYLWEAGNELARRAPSERDIFTSKKAIYGATTTTLDATVNPKEPVFNTAMSGTLKAALNEDGTYTANNIIGYIRGECLETGVSGDTACGSTPDATYRDRRITVSGGDTNGNVWKLGDIINSTPKVFGNMPLLSYHMTYGDNSYTAYLRTDEFQKRSSIAFIGANDGMLHAVRVGYLKDKPDEKGAMPSGVKAFFKDLFADEDSTPPDQLGEEVWAYIPYNAYPYLKYLADPAYCHIYYNDLTVNLVDASLGCETDTACDEPLEPKVQDATKSSWRTILIGGMRFAGACGGGTTPAGPPAGAPADVGFSSFYAIDITDPENPIPMWEFTDPDLGYTSSYPAIIRTGDPGVNGYWYVALGSGSQQLPKSASDVGRTSPGQIYILDMKTGARLQKIELDHNGIVGDILAIDADKNYRAEKLYFGTAYYEDSTWKGKLESIAIPDQDLSIGWTPAVTHLFEGDQPFTASPDATKDEKLRVWVYQGSGKYLSDIDEGDTSQQLFLGIKDDPSAIAYPVPIAELDDRTNTPTTGTVTETSQVCMYDSSASSFAKKSLVTSINLTSAVPLPSVKGWYLNLSTAPTAERVISRPLAIGGLVDFLSYKPNNDPCAAGGDSYLYSVGYTTGVAPANVAILHPDVTDATSGEVTVAKGIRLGPGAPPAGEAIIIPPPKDESDRLKKKIQVATGVIIEAENETALSVTSRIMHWLRK